MRNLHYSGEVSASKSLINRALILQSFVRDLRIEGESKADDVVFLKKSLTDFANGKTNFDCGAGGTSFRFLLARLSRTKGVYFVRADARLLSRPHKELFISLEQLNCKLTLLSDGVKVKSSGWDDISEVSVDVSKTSQFLSALVLCSLDRDVDTGFKLKGDLVSQSYFKMTLDVLAQLGVTLDFNGSYVLIPKNSNLKKFEFTADADASSVFALACHSAISGTLEVSNCKFSSLQPDHFLIKKMNELGVLIDWTKGHLSLKGSSCLQPVSWDLSNNPDVFPVLAVLLSKAQGTSHLMGLEVLKYKESDRLNNTINLLAKLGVKVVVESNAVSIVGSGSDLEPLSDNFDPDQDHRMAMAASLCNYLGAKQFIDTPKVVNKSFPEFWSIVQ